MEVVISARLIRPCSLLEDVEIKKFDVCVLTVDESYQKIRNVWDTLYQSGALPIRIIDIPGYEGYKLTIKVTNIAGKISNQLLKIPKDQWENMEVKIRFTVRKYKFRSKFAENQGNIVSGYNFILKYIDV